MNWEAIGAMGELLGATAVFGSLLFVGWQIKANTKTARLRMHEQTTQSTLSFLMTAVVDSEAFAAGLKSTDKNFSDLSDGQKMHFFATMLGMFKHFELMFVQYSQGTLDKKTWDAWSVHARMHIHQPGAQTWWGFRKDMFIPEFRAFLDSSSPPEMTSFVDVMNPEGRPATPVGLKQDVHKSEEGHKADIR
jgi:hypothetical protein